MREKERKRRRQNSKEAQLDNQMCKVYAKRKRSRGL